MSKNSIHLVATYYKKPRAGVNTSQKGWMDNPDNIQWDEQVEIVKKLRNKDQGAQVVLDLGNHKIVHNRFETDKTFDEVFEYFYINYSDYITKVMGKLDPAYLQELVDKLQKQLDNEVNNEEIQAK